MPSSPTPGWQKNQAMLWYMWAAVKEKVTASDRAFVMSGCAFMGTSGVGSPRRAPRMSTKTFSTSSWCGKSGRPRVEAWAAAEVPLVVERERGVVVGWMMMSARSCGPRTRARVSARSRTAAQPLLRAAHHARV